MQDSEGTPEDQILIVAEMKLNSSTAWLLVPGSAAGRLLLAQAASGRSPRPRLLRCDPDRRHMVELELRTALAAPPGAGRRGRAAQGPAQHGRHGVC